MSYPSISLIIPTYRREQILKDTLEDVLKQDYPNLEILVVDQTEIHDPTIETYLDNLAKAHKIKWFRVSWASLPAARNYGVRRCQGDIIIFIDDDVQLPKDYLQTHAKVYQENQEIGALAGRVLDRMKLADSEKINKTQDPYTIEMLPPEAMDPAIAWYHIDLVHTTKPQEVISARGCNMSFRRKIFTKYNIWFDERFRGNAVREESDFCLRLRQTNYKIWYEPDAYLVHLGEETGGCHDISTRSFSYQMTFYHNHFLMALKNLTWKQQFRLYTKLFDCHVLGNPPCNKGGSPLKIIVRLLFYILGLVDAIKTIIMSRWDDGQIYSKNDLDSQELYPDKSLESIS
ncbi:hormogonium polysaccharide biosynthesis glycosyltransferase HpsN [Crocosphaera sp. Alani8]|uniref:hormogonium polysaccharide biosynthesis glycosyltransferase HpsN n=1 Tax=Crocosphaera sp. Alani8 TaxID=3038952 RepID=UPI00313F23DA